MTKILVPFDGSASSERMMSTAKRFAAMMNAEVVFVHVLDQRDAVSRSAAAREQAEQHLQILLADVFLDARAVVHEAGTAVRGILEMISEEKADLVLMATHGGNCAREQAMGSVARDLVRTSAVPVMLVGLGAIPEPPAASDSPGAN